MQKTYYRILYQKKQDPSCAWYSKKGYYETLTQAEKYISVLEQVSDIYAALRTESFIVNVPDPAKKAGIRAGKSKRKKSI